MDKKAKKTLLSIHLALLLVAALVSLPLYNNAYAAVEDGLSHAIDIGKRVSVKSVLNKQPLGVEFKVNEYGSVHLEMINNSSEDLIVGSDMFIWAEGSRRFNVALIMSADNPIDKAHLSNYVYACGVNNFAKEKGDSALWAFGPGGDWLNLSGFYDSFEGKWSKKLHAQGKGMIVQRLATWPGSKRGWVATPVLSVANGPKFRILAELGEKKKRQPVVVPMTVKSLEELIRDSSTPLAIRGWAACWLASLPEKDQWKSAASLLADRSLDIEVRKALARSLSTLAPSEALSVVDKVLWDTATPAGLRLICYYSFTWSGHEEAKSLIKKAANHPDRKIRNDARRRTSGSS